MRDKFKFTLLLTAETHGSIGAGANEIVHLKYRHLTERLAIAWLLAYFCLKTKDVGHEGARANLPQKDMVVYGPSESQTNTAPYLVIPYDLTIGTKVNI